MSILERDPLDASSFQNLACLKGPRAEAGFRESFIHRCVLAKRLASPFN